MWAVNLAASMAVDWAAKSAGRWVVQTAALMVADLADNLADLTVESMAAKKVDG